MGRGNSGLNWTERNWVWAELNSNKFNWNQLFQTQQNWIEISWIQLSRTESVWIELNELNWSEVLLKVWRSVPYLSVSSTRVWRRSCWSVRSRLARCRSSQPSCSQRPAGTTASRPERNCTLSATSWGYYCVKWARTSAPCRRNWWDTLFVDWFACVFVCLLTYFMTCLRIV